MTIADRSGSKTSYGSLPRGSTVTGLTLGPRKLPVTRRQLMTIAALSFGNLCLGSMYAILAPFFPFEAEMKGVSPTQYGLVFGIFEFGQFIFAPLIGKIIPTVSAKFFVVIGLFITAYCNAFFGILEWSPPGMMFFSLAFLLRLVTSFGGSSYLTACFTLIAIDFPDRISTFFAMTEMCFGLGMIVGPSMGGFFYEVGGFSLPFFVTSVLTLLATAFSYFTLETKEVKQEKKSEIPENEKVTMWKLISTFSIFINIFINFTTFVNIGFMDATLEHHIRDFTSLPPSRVGLIFMIAGLVYAISSQLFGLVMDKVDAAHAFCIFGYIFSLAGYLLSGPMYPLPLKPSIMFIIISQVLLGISFGAIIVAAFSEGLKQIVKSGFSDDINTTSLMSALYQSSCALGATIGPVMGGYLMDTFGYEKACISMALLQFIMIVVLITYQTYVKCCRRSVKLSNDS